MNKTLFKFVTDIGPLVIFFFFYYNSDKNLKVAIPPLIVATIIAVLIVWILEKKIPLIPLLSGILITLFGGLTIYFDNPIFIYMKPTIINILFGLALMFGKFFTEEPILKKILGKSLPLSDEGWKILNNRWMYFFFGSHIFRNRLIPFLGIVKFKINIINYTSKIKMFMLNYITYGKFCSISCH